MSFYKLLEFCPTSLSRRIWARQGPILYPNFFDRLFLKRECIELQDLGKAQALGALPLDYNLSRKVFIQKRSSLRKILEPSRVIIRINATLAATKAHRGIFLFFVAFSDIVPQIFLYNCIWRIFIARKKTFRYFIFEEYLFLYYKACLKFH